MTTENIIKPL